MGKHDICTEVRNRFEYFTVGTFFFGLITPEELVESRNSQTSYLKYFFIAHVEKIL